MLDVEIEVAEGLESVALAELNKHYAIRIAAGPRVVRGALRFGYEGNLGGLLVLQTVHAVYLVETYDIPRPKAFLGHQHFTRLTEQLQSALDISGSGQFKTFTIGAAGSNSSVMRRLRDELAAAVGLESVFDEGDLFMRLRPAKGKRGGWEALVRISPRPSATRDWRVENLPGALNAAVAHALIHLSNPEENDVVLNVACGSGTIAIERRRFGPVARVIACDIDTEALLAAGANIRAANVEIELQKWDAMNMPLEDESVDVIYADLPFGTRTGSHRNNKVLYPGVLAEAARVAKLGARFGIVTAEVNLIESILRQQDVWETSLSTRITLSGLQPLLLILTRT